MQMDLQTKQSRNINKFSFELYDESDFVFNDGKAGPVFPIELRQTVLKKFDLEAEPPPTLLRCHENKSENEFLLKNALILIRASEFKLASNVLLRILQSDPYNAETLKWLGHCYENQKEVERALVCYREWVKVEESDVSLNSLADSLYKLGQYDESLQTYFMALESIKSETPLLFDIYKNIGNIYVRMGDFDLAEENYNRAYTLCPDSDILMVNYGTLEIQREQYDKAVLRFRRAVEINDQNDKAWVGLGLIHRNFGDLELAWANMERALDANFENTTALQLISQWGVQDHCFEIPQKRLERYLVVYSMDANMSYMLAQVLCAMGNLEKAKIELERTLCLNPQNIEAYSILDKINEFFSLEKAKLK